MFKKTVLKKLSSSVMNRFTHYARRKKNACHRRNFFNRIRFAKEEKKKISFCSDRAHSDYWCEPPAKFQDDLNAWRNHSSPKLPIPTRENLGFDTCRVYDVDYDAFDSIQDMLGKVLY